MSVQVFRQPIVILNSVEHAVNLLDKRSATYSDRPQLTLACEMVGWSKTLALMPYGDTFRGVRKFFHQSIGPREVEKVIPLVGEETTKFLVDLLHTPDQVTERIRKFVVHAHLHYTSHALNAIVFRTTGSIVLLLVYGYRTKEHDDPLVKLVDEVTENFAVLTSPGAFLVDVIPIRELLSLDVFTSALLFITLWVQ